MLPGWYGFGTAVKTWIAEASMRGLRFEYEMFETAEQKRLARGYTKHVFCDREVRPARLPEKYWHKFGIL